MSIDARILLAFNKLVPLVERYILRSRFIATDDKDPLARQLRDVLTALNDANKRTQGAIPRTSQQQKSWDDAHKRLFPWDRNYKAATDK